MFQLLLPDFYLVKCNIIYVYNKDDEWQFTTFTSVCLVQNISLILKLLVELYLNPRP